MNIYLDEYCPELFDLIDAARITQVRLARTAGVARGTLNCWMAGVNRVSTEMADHLCAVARKLAKEVADA